ncbi:MAG: serine/threonine protein kinase [Planctomycetes bacterium]|nr:serine/threonine protein kinase [Planctomycetota bacterium]
MSDYSSDQNLLFGVLALQNCFISREQLIAAVSVWLQDKSQSLGKILRESNALPEDEHALLAALVNKHLERHENDAEKSLAAVSSLEPSIREELARLGDAHVEASLSHLPATKRAEGAYAATIALPPARSDRFQILRPHAKGGLGQVSVALDYELNREVALKEIQPQYADSADVRARFVQEAEITGGLEHPGIVPVYGLGQYANGLPFYAMRFVRGENLKEAVNRFHQGRSGTSGQSFQSVEFRKLLGRFIDVCNAVEYAHSRGILHRDLKPRNIMLGKYGETLVVDWGLAKAIGRTDSDTGTDEPTLHPSSGSGSIETFMGQTIGTPAYMSPEQAEGRLDKLQSTSDVYSLGATLYYLLTGQPSVQSDNVAETLAIVCKGEFPPPSQLEPHLPLALEAVCLKAMALDPGQRYQRAVDLANELELWLADEPVSAHRESALVRCGRTLRKHRTAATTILAILITSTVGLSVFGFFITSKNTALEVARNDAENNRKQADRERRNAENNRKQADQERRNAEENLATARAIALNILKIAEQNLSGVPGMEGFRETMMDRCYAMFKKIYDQTPDDPLVTREFAKVARMSGNLKRLFQKHGEARIRLVRSIELQKKLPQATTKQRDYLAQTYRDLGTLEKAAGDLTAANNALSRASELISLLIKQSSNTPNMRRTQGRIDLELVGLHIDLLEIDQALAAATRSAATFAELAGAENSKSLDPVIAMLALSRRGQMLDRLNRREEASRVFAEGLRNGRVWLKRNPDRNRRYAFGRILLRSVEGSVKEDPIPADSASQIDEALSTFANLVKGFPRTPYRYYLGDCWRVRALLHQRLNEPMKARKAFAQAITIIESLVSKVERSSYRDKLAQVYADRARFQLQQGDRDAAQKSWKNAIKNAQQASQAQPANRDIRQRLETFEKASKSLREGCLQ